MQLGSRCLVLFFFRSLSLFAPYFFCFFFSSNTKTKRSCTHKMKLILSVARSRPTLRVTQNVYSSFSFFALFVLRLPSAPTLFTSRTMPLWFILFYANLSPCLFQYLSLSQLMYPVCVRFIISVSFYQNLSKMLCYRSLSFFRIRIWKKANEKNIRKYLLCLS